MDTSVLLVGALLVMAGILVSPLSARIGMPALLLFLGVGMLAGEDGPGGITFNDFSSSFVVANLALAIILLDGGMRTKVETFRVGLRPALVLASLGVVITAGVAGLVAAWALDLPPLVGLLTGAIISSTDASVVFSLLQGRELNLNERVEATLEIESGSNDPMAIFLTLMLIEWIQEGQASLWSGLAMLVQQFGLGALAGLAGGFLAARLLNKVELVPAMYPLLVASSGIALFAATNALGGSGFLAVYLMGVVLSSQNLSRLESLLQIHDGLAWLAQLILFLLMGLLVTPSQLLLTAPEALLISLALILVARPLSTVVSLLPFGFSWREHLFISWVGLRGAVPIVLAMFPLIAGLPFSPQIFQVTFVVVLASLMLQGSTLAPLARRLKLEVPGKREPAFCVPLEFPSTGNHELLLFPLKGKRWSTPVEITDIHLPDPSRIVALFREGRMYERRRGLLAAENDMIAVLGRRDQRDDISRILGWEEPPERLTDRRFFGEFTVNGDARLGDVEGVYGVTVKELDSALTLSACFERTTHGHPVVGDRLDLGSILLVAREVHGDKVTRVGLKLSRDR